MKTSLVRLGQHFGSIQKNVRGITKYHLSPFEQKATAGFFSQGVPNLLWSIRSNIFFIAPPMLLGYYIYVSATAEYERLQRKQPGEFDHET